MPKIYRECIQCESDFYIKESDQAFFEQKGLELPKRCWPCRQKNKREAAEAKARQAEADRSARTNGNRRPRRSPGHGTRTEDTVERTRHKRND